MAKSIFMAGGDAGFDMTSKAGIDAYMHATQDRPLPASISLPSPGASVGSKAKKDKRKAARKARKRNR